MRIRTSRRNEEQSPESRTEPPVSPGRARQDEAIRIAERLEELVASRRREAGLARPEPRTVVGARHSGRLLGNLLVARGFIVESELQRALAMQAAQGGALGRIFVDLDYISERDLVEVLGEQLRMPVVDPTRAPHDRRVVTLVPQDVARRLGAIALRRDEDRIEVAIADPTDDAGVDELTRILGVALRLVLAARGDIDAAIERLYR